MKFRTYKQTHTTTSDAISVPLSLTLDLSSLFLYLSYILSWLLVRLSRMCIARFFSSQYTKTVQIKSIYTWTMWEPRFNASMIWLHVCVYESIFLCFVCTFWVRRSGKRAEEKRRWRSKYSWTGIASKSTNLQDEWGTQRVRERERGGKELRTHSHLTHEHTNFT